MNRIAQQYFNYGFNSELENKFVEAIEFYNEAIKRDSNYAMAYINRGNVYLKLGMSSKCREDHVKAKQINPNLPVFYIPAS